MTNLEKTELRRRAQDGWTFKQIRRVVECSDATIRRYIKVFAPKKEKTIDHKIKALEEV